MRGALHINEVDDAPLLMDALFQGKFGHPAPDFPRHLGAFSRAVAGSIRLISHLHMQVYGPSLLSGGSCADGDAIRAMAHAIGTF